MKILPKPNVILNSNHTILEYNSVISKDICVDLIKIYDSKLQPGKSKNEHLWKAQFHTSLLLDTNHIIHDLLVKFWDDYISKTKIKIEHLEYYEIKRYDKGDFFEPHRDNYYVLDSCKDRKVNLILQLSDNLSYTGGDLYIGNKKTMRDIGSVILFPAMYYHEVKILTAGQRYSLIGHAWGPNWI